MEILKLLPFFLLFSLCSFVAAKPACRASQCSWSGPSPTVRFPFRLTNQNSTSSCGYPGFNLSCATSKETIIHLHSVPFIVREINYTTQQIRINDPDFTCLPGKILSMNLSGTPFRGAFYQVLSFFSCSSWNRSELEPIACLSNSTRSVFVTSSSLAVTSNLFESCDVIKTVSVPVPSPGFGEVPGSNLDQDLVLQWDLPGCQGCESRGLLCGLKHSSGLEVACLPQGWSTGQKVSLGIVAGVFGGLYMLFTLLVWIVFNLDFN